MIFLMLIGTFLFLSFMTVSRLPFWLSSTIAGLDVSTLVLVALIAVMFLILGFFLPEFPMILLTIPILFPVINAVGIDPIWFGVIVVKMMMVGAISPPIGMVVLVLGGITRVPVTTIFRGIVPFLIAEFIVIAILILFPKLSLFLPNLM